jgi:hypothetical protein
MPNNLGKGRLIDPKPFTTGGKILLAPQPKLPDHPHIPNPNHRLTHIKPIAILPTLENQIALFGQFATFVPFILD